MIFGHGACMPKNLIMLVMTHPMKHTHTHTHWLLAAGHWWLTLNFDRSNHKKNHISNYWANLHPIFTQAGGHQGPDHIKIWLKLVQ